ncbi:MAG: hypothetical protein HZA90_02185 [Verrucomicrobia bacterium]|nr:hypothetical protein [Verrucomicrobiota bacterium]
MNSIDPLLKSHLEPLVRRRGQIQLYGKLAVCWLATGLVGLMLHLPMALVAVLGVIAALVIVFRQRRREPDYRWAAQQVEARHPELNGLLLTAVQQQPKDGHEFNYLQAQLVRQAVEHSSQHNWGAALPEFRSALTQAAHLLALVFCIAVLWNLRPLASHTPRLAAKQPAAKSGMTVTPGDTSLERGSSLVVMARFEGPVPAAVELVLGSTPETSRRLPLVRSLADPMFGVSVPEVDKDFTYHLEYGGERTRDFRVKVFEHPKLERANAGLTFPEYTGQPPKHIEDTRRLSAVEGTRLDLTLQLNKPVVSARLVAKGEETNAISLVVESNRPAASLPPFTLAASKTYHLQLVDADGRTNKVPTQFVFDVLKNRRPELKLASPRGDIRPSALEEVQFEGTAWDDFGVRAYGLAYTLAGGETKVIELGHAVPAKEKRAFQQVIRLEELGVKPDDLVSYFVWADDIGPDGQPRRTTGDLFFAEVRPFEEIFREGQGGEGQSAQQQQSGEQGGEQGSPSAKLAELQKQIISATWKLWRENGTVPASPAGAKDKGSSARPPNDSKTSAASPSPLNGEKSERVLGASFLSPDDARRRPVAQVSNLLCRRLPVGRVLESGERPADWKSAIQPVGNLRHAWRPSAAQLFAQAAPQRSPLLAPSERSPRARTTPAISTNNPSQFRDDTGVVRDSQEQALEQAESLKERVQDPRLTALWEAASKEMEKALEKLKAAEKSPELLKDALAAEQAAYQALLKLQEREYSVSRSRQRSQSGRQNQSSRQQQMQQQLDQMELQQQENRYETERQAQAPQSPERREQLQVMNRLAELARRQQDVNERLKELQTALQEARTEQQKEELRRQLKRLQEEEQKMLADADELQQRMERPENQSRMAEQRKQLEQARQDMQRAAQAAEQGSASQALASGTRAQRQMQEMRDEMRRQNASEFAEDLREMRAEARELARQQEEVKKKIDALKDSQRKTLTDSDQRKEVLDQLSRQKERLTNLVERATQVSQQSEEAEPLVSRELYDTLRKFSQDDASSVKRLQEDLVNSGTLSRSLYERLKETAERENAKALETTSEMLRQGMLPQAGQAEERARSSIGNLRRGVERAAERVLGDDAETLRLAQRQLDELTGQLEREMAQAQRAGNTNGQPQPGEGREGQDARQQPQQGQGQQAQLPNDQSREGQQSQAGEVNPQNQQQSQSAQAGGERQRGSQQQGQDGQQPRRGEGQRPGEQQQRPGEQGQAQGQGQGQGQRQGEDQQSASAQRNQQGQRTQRNPGQRGGSRLGGPQAGGDRGGTGDLVEGLDWLREDPRSGWTGPITGNDFAPWSDRLREVEEMVELPSLRNEVAAARERARQMRQEFKRSQKKPDWAVVRLQVMKPLVEVRNQIADELARREPKDKLVPIDRDPVPTKYSDLVRRYYEELGKEK